MSELTEPTINGWQNLGKVLIWTMGKLQGNEQVLYMAIARKCVGYQQYTTELLSYQQLANYTGISLPSIKRIIPKLIESDYIIKLATNQIENTGKLPYKYQLNMKLSGFPSLGKLRKSRDESPNSVNQFVCPPIEEYFLHGDHILSVADNLQKYEILSNQGRILHPTVEELTEFLKD